MTHISRIQLIPLFSPATMHTSRAIVFASPFPKSTGRSWRVCNVLHPVFFFFLSSTLRLPSLLFPQITPLLSPPFFLSTLPRGLLAVVVVVSTHNRRNFHLDVCLGSSVHEDGAPVDDGYNNRITTTRIKPQIVIRMCAH